MMQRSSSRTQKKSTPTSAMSESASARLSLGNDLVDSSTEEERKITFQLCQLLQQGIQHPELWLL